MAGLMGWWLVGKSVPGGGGVEVYWRLGHRSALLHRPGQALGERPNRDRSIGYRRSPNYLGPEASMGAPPGQGLGLVPVARLQLPWGGACRIRSALSVRCPVCGGGGGEEESMEV